MNALDVLQNIEQTNIRAIAAETINDNKEVAADLVATQLAQGVRSDGSEILPSYSPLTIEIKKTKQGLAAITDHVTLYDTGAHYSELYVETQGEDMEYGSRVPYAVDLEKKYDTAKGKIHKLTEDSKDELVKGYLENDFYSKAHEVTGL